MGPLGNIQGPGEANQIITVPVRVFIPIGFAITFPWRQVFLADSERNNRVLSLHEPVNDFADQLQAGRTCLGPVRLLVKMLLFQLNQPVRPAIESVIENMDHIHGVDPR